MGEREPEAELLALFSPETGLLTGPAVGRGDVTLTQHLIAPDELATMNQAAEAIRLDLHFPHILPRYQALFRAEPPHPAG